MMTFYCFYYTVWSISQDNIEKETLKTIEDEGGGPVGEGDYILDPQQIFSGK